MPSAREHCLYRSERGVIRDKIHARAVALKKSVSDGRAPLKKPPLTLLKTRLNNPTHETKLVTTHVSQREIGEGGLA